MCQETRDSETRIQERESFIIVSAQANGSGQYGCRVYINCNVPYAKRAAVGFMKVQLQHISISHHDPRQLLVSVDAPGLRVAIVSLHAPHSGDSDGAAWWAQTLRIMKLQCASRSIVAGMDANVHVTTESFPLIGDHLSVPNTRSKYEKEFIDCLSEVGLVLPATFKVNCEREIQSTFVARGCSAVCDYIGTSSKICVKPGSCRVLCNFDTGREADDHLPIGAPTHFKSAYGLPIYCFCVLGVLLKHS